MVVLLVWEIQLHNVISRTNFPEENKINQDKNKEKNKKIKNKKRFCHVTRGPKYETLGNQCCYWNNCCISRCQISLETKKKL